MSLGSSSNVRKKAEQIVRMNGVKKVGENLFEVSSTSGSVYNVKTETIEDYEKKPRLKIKDCSCPSWQVGKRTYCSHGEAVELFTMGVISNE